MTSVHDFHPKYREAQYEIFATASTTQLKKYFDDSHTGILISEFLIEHRITPIEQVIREYCSSEEVIEKLDDLLSIKNIWGRYIAALHLLNQPINWIRGTTLLHQAVTLSYDDPSCKMLKKILATGACTEVREHIAEHTPLHNAAILGIEHAVQTLLAAGADRTARNIGGKTPHELAIQESKRIKEHSFHALRQKKIFTEIARTLEL